ncbi:hypothetical protein TWF506_008960 [Arthrobotrys conoides]|uniref:Uncharacterized protein n=1 Tax=Arthrobotrys conoides TaxID=74498 RepID=A0AAN8N830_9PEZI
MAIYLNIIFGFIALLLVWPPASSLPTDPLKPSSSSSLPSLTSKPTSAMNRTNLIRSLKQAHKNPEFLALFAHEPNGRSDSDTRLHSRVVDPTVVYTWAVVCPSVAQISDMDSNPDSYPRVGSGTRPRITTSMDILVLLGTLVQCKDCICLDDGTMAVNPAHADHDPNESNQGICRQERLIPECTEWYETVGCTCVFQVQQPSIEPSNALKADHVDDKWDKLAKLSQLSWRNAGSGSGGTDRNPTHEGSPRLDRNVLYKGADDRQLVPGTKESYYLEGPGERDPIAWITGPSLNGPGLESPGFRRVRRDGVGEGEGEGDEES